MPCAVLSTLLFVISTLGLISPRESVCNDGAPLRGGQPLDIPRADDHETLEPHSLQTFRYRGMFWFLGWNLYVSLVYSTWLVVVHLMLALAGGILSCASKPARTALDAWSFSAHITPWEAIFSNASNLMGVE